MKKLPTSCAVVVFLAVLACRVDATIIALTKGTGTPGTLTAMDVSRLTEYDLTSAKNKIPDAVYVRDNNDLILPTTSAAMPGSLILEDKGLPEYNPMPDIATLFSSEDLFAVNEILDVVYVRDNNDLILSATSAAMPGSLILEDKGLPEYNPMPDVATLFSAKDLFAVNDPDYDPIAGIATLFFDEDLFAGNQLTDAIYIPRDNNIIPSAAPDAMPNRLTLENSGTIKYNPTTNIAALHLGESIFANMDTYASYRRIDVLYVTTDGIVTPEPTTIAVLGLGSLFLLRKRKGV
ncbi:hypothetical protein ES707_17148 [subsurface metagenome]